MLKELNYKRLFILLSVLFMSSLIMLSVNPVRTGAPRPADGNIRQDQWHSDGVHSSFSRKDGVKKEEIKQPELTASIILTPSPELKAQAYTVKIVGVNRPLLSQREWKRLAPASLTKILTAVLAKEILPADEKIIFSKETKQTEEKLSPLKADEETTRDKAIELALVNSFNDAALALAESIGKSRGGVNFAERLAIFKTLANEKTHLLRLQDSEFKNPIGLDEDGHYATAQDLAELAEYIWLRHSDLWTISRQVATVVGTENGTEYKINNTNELLKEFPAILGGKTGFTDKARGALLFLYPLRPNKTVVVVILSSEDRFGDGRKIINWLETSGLPAH